MWLVDRTESDDIPPLPDTVFGLVTFLAVGPTALLNGLLPLPNLPLGFTIDRVVVSSGLLWGSEPLGAGTVNVFQKIFFRRLSLLNESTSTVLFEETTSPPALSALVPDLAGETDDMAWMGPILDRPHLGLPGLRLASFSPSACGGPSFPRLVRTASGGSSNGGSVKLDKLISQGAKLFFEETFNGNGRTCGTCHPANNNFMIDAAFIATLPANDPLFVAEFNPALAQLERPQLMRQFGLILENLDGFSNPTTKFVMRGVPHTLGLQVSLERDTALVPPAPAEMTGWSGDGAPGTGSLREFAIGAVTQHFTKTLARVAGTDFKLPKEHQLDAMEAFQLSLGRSADFDLAKITFTDANANTGKSLFINGGGNPNFGGTCNFCHTNAGALTGTAQNQNRNFNTNVEDVVHPARSVQNFPKDGGFGRTPTTATARSATARSTRPRWWKRQTPRRSFTTTSSTTLEDAVDFYSGPEFNNPRAPAARFNFNRDAAQPDRQLPARAEYAPEHRRRPARAAGNPREHTATHRASRPPGYRRRSTRRRTRLMCSLQGGIFPAAMTHLIDARNLISQAQLNTEFESTPAADSAGHREARLRRQDAVATIAS